MKYLIIGIILISSCQSKQVDFPLDLNSEMTAADVENKLQAHLEKLPNMAYGEVLDGNIASKPPSKVVYELKKIVDVDDLKFDDIIFLFDTCRNSKLCSIVFGEHDLIHVINIADWCLGFKENMTKEGFEYLESKHFNNQPSNEQDNSFKDSGWDWYLKNRILIVFTVGHDFQKIDYSFLNDNELKIVNAQKVYKVHL
jgi:hypothetical protein